MEDRMNDKNYYDILGVSEKATLEDITAAKNELAKKYHPEKAADYADLRSS